MEVLDFIARFGTVPRDAVATWAGTAKTATQTRERRLALAGLIEVSRPWGEIGPFANATRVGLGACLRDELPVARESPSKLRHQAVCARLAARLERDGRLLLSERELRAEERAWGKRVNSIRLRTRLHRPDLMALPAGTDPALLGGAAWLNRALKRSQLEEDISALEHRREASTASPRQGGQGGEPDGTRDPIGGAENAETNAAPGLPSPIEVELSRKAQGRLEEIVRRWRAAVDEARFQRVHYYCTTAVLPYVQRAVDAAGAEEQVSAEVLPEEDALVASLWS
jgi:hypothetical protein